MEHRTIQANGISIHLVEAGEGPLVVLLHGFPEGWYSWRHQLSTLSESGYHVVAVDQRGYGGSDAPSDPADYTQLHLVGDVVGILTELGEGSAVIVGHDWGAPVAWNTALLRPDLVRAVVGVGVPYSPPADVDVLSILDAALGPHHYQRWFQTEAAQVELEADVRRSILVLYGAVSGHHGHPHDLVLGEGRTLLEALPASDVRPPWMTEADLEHVVGEFTRSGFLGGLNWYRNARRNQQLLRPWAGQPVVVPAAYVTGDLDVVYRWPGMGAVVEMLPTFVPNLLSTLLLPGCGHWTAEERPNEVNDFLLEFLARL